MHRLRLKKIFFGRTTRPAELPGPGIEPVPPALEVWSINHGTAREVLRYII